MKRVDFNTILDGALFWQKLGCSVIPLRHMDKRPYISSWKPYDSERADEQLIRNWWKSGKEEINFGLVCGTISHVAVIDVDGEKGDEWFKATIVPTLPGGKPAVIQTTSKAKKYHVFFALPDDVVIRPSVKDLADEIDVRAESSYVVAAPSVHPTGAIYKLYYDDERFGSIEEAFDNLPPVPELMLEKQAEKQQRNAAPSAPIAPVKDYGENDRVPQGERNATVVSMCGRWYGMGLREYEVSALALDFNRRHCDPPLSDGEVLSAVTSMKNTHARNNLYMPNAGGIERFIQNTDGATFSVNDILTGCGATGKLDKQDVTATLKALCDAGTIERVNKAATRYRLKDKSIKIIDITDMTPESKKDLWLPFGLDDRTALGDKSIVIIAGETNSGKTALLFNFCYRNLAKGWHINYITSELTRDKIRKRVARFPEAFDANNKPVSWSSHVTFIDRQSDYADIINPEGINIVDYLEVYDEFYAVGDQIKKIFDRLTTGIAIIALQKKKGVDIGRGGEFSLEKASLALSLFYHGQAPNGDMVGSALVTKCKDVIDGEISPNGKELYYTLRAGAKYIHGLKAIGISDNFEYLSEKTRDSNRKSIEKWCEESDKKRVRYKPEDYLIPEDVENITF